MNENEISIAPLSYGPHTAKEKMMLPKAKHKFVIRQNGEIRHLVSYDSKGFTDVTEQDGDATNEDMVRWAKTLGVKMEEEK